MSTKKDENEEKPDGEKRMKKPKINYLSFNNKYTDLNMEYPPIFQVKPIIFTVPHPTLPGKSLRGIVPFYTTLVTYCKRRWIGRSLGEAFTKEFPVRGKQNVLFFFSIYF